MIFFVFGISKTYSQGHSTYGCGSCHITHTAPGTQLTDVAGNALLCQSCHKNAGIAKTLPLPDAIIAVPGVSGTSHAWNKPEINFTYETNLPVNTNLSDRIMSGNIVCSTCHDQHNSNTLPDYLRIANTSDELCKDCHSVRNVGLYTSNPTVNKGSHPVGLTYNTSDTRLLATPSGSVILNTEILNVQVVTECTV